MATFEIVLDVEGYSVKNVGNIPYDVGYIVRNTRTGEIVRRVRHIVAEAWRNTEQMATCYYAEKLPEYYMNIGRGELCIVPFATIRAEFANICSRYHVKRVWAFNASYDKGALDTACSMFDDGGSFVPDGVNWACIWRYCVYRFASLDYQNWARSNDFVTSTGRVRTTAEAAYKYFNDTLDFVEDHTALSDAEIEAEILAKQRQKHMKADWGLGSDWRLLDSLLQV